LGNSNGDRQPGRRPAVHPHERGELLSDQTAGRGWSGSSPRMWGTPTDPLRGTNLVRFIPTHVGNSRSGCKSPGSEPVHPHACGELILLITAPAGCAGSSPRMWGTPRLFHGLLLRCRFIPTHVGNSNLPSVPNVTITVHPHACGELTTSVIRIGDDCGSSPRMWGTHLHNPLRAHPSRFIPTHVGNSLDERSGRDTPAVHPHACGELLGIRRLLKGRNGSSPRMWGTLEMEQPDNLKARFIPTHVGNSRQVRWQSPSGPVHPHACGELLIADIEIHL